MDRRVDDLAYTFGVQRVSLNVVSVLSFLMCYSSPYLIHLFKVAAAKGLVAGNFSITRVDGSIIEGTKDLEVWRWTSRIKLEAYQYS